MKVMEKSERDRGEGEQSGPFEEVARGLKPQWEASQLKWLRWRDPKVDGHQGLQVGVSAACWRESGGSMVSKWREE